MRRRMAAAGADAILAWNAAHTEALARVLHQADGRGGIGGEPRRMHAATRSGGTGRLQRSLA